MQAINAEWILTDKKVNCNAYIFENSSLTLPTTVKFAIGIMAYFYMRRSIDIDTWEKNKLYFISTNVTRSVVTLDAGSDYLRLESVGLGKETSLICVMLVTWSGLEVTCRLVHRASSTVPLASYQLALNESTNVLHQNLLHYICIILYTLSTRYANLEIYIFSPNFSIVSSLDILGKILISQGRFLKITIFRVVVIIIIQKSNKSLDGRKNINKLSTLYRLNYRAFYVKN